MWSAEYKVSIYTNLQKKYMVQTLDIYFSKIKSCSISLDLFCNEFWTFLRYILYTCIIWQVIYNELFLAEAEFVYSYID